MRALQAAEPTTALRAHAGHIVRRGRELLDPLELRAAGIAAPLPPRRLRARTGAAGARAFHDGGRLAADSLLAAAPPGPGAADARLERVLDFGCGSGRVLPWIARCRPGARCLGCDVDAEAVAWASEHWPTLGFAVSSSRPPLPYPDASVDLLYSISVFSHLDEDGQDAWLAELARVVRPGGVLLLSVQGQHALDAFRSGAVRSSWTARDAFSGAPIGDDGFRFVPYRRSRSNRAELPGVAAVYGLAFHGAGYVRDRWSRVLDVVEVRPRAISGWQDLVVARRPPDTP